MALQSRPFPIDTPVMPESRQIGRQSAIDGLEAGMEAMTHQWIVGPRRIGKTSVAKAVLARRRKAGHVALDVDLSKLDLKTTVDLAGEIARQAQAADVGAQSIASRRIRDLARRKTPQARRLGQALEHFGFEDGGQALEAVASILAGADDGSPGLSAVLEALSVHGHATGRYAAILLDEVHLLAGIPGSDREVARWCRDDACGVVFVFAGSEDWLRGLRRRFEETGVSIDSAELFAIVEASDGHPRRTMLIASYVHSKAALAPDRTALPTLVELAIRDARKDRAWA